MFERYTERARRVIFFARYEAGQYGSLHIETEHLLLGLLREDRPLANRFLSGAYETEIRAEIERRIPPRERIATSVEIPLTEECEKVLNFATEEAERLGNRHVDTEHLFLGLLRLEGALAAEILQAKGLKFAKIREELPNIAAPTTVRAPLATRYSLGAPNTVALSRLDEFLAGLKWHSADELTPFLADSATLIDVHGKRWNREEIVTQFDTLFAPYAKKNAAYIVEESRTSPYGLVIAIVLWKNAILASMERVWMHRMSVVLVRGVEDWAIALVQVTPVKPS